MWLIIFQIIICLFLIILIIIQTKGTGLGTTFGGQQQLYHSKRGVEKTVFITTLIAALIFILISLINFRL